MWEIPNIFNKMFSFVPLILSLYAIVNHMDLISSLYSKAFSKE